MFFDSYASEKRVSSFISAVYGWMSGALAITAGVAYSVQATPSLFGMLQQPGVMIGLLIAQLVFVIMLVTLINRMSYGMALVLFVLYAASLGMSLSPIFYVYTHASIISTFLTTALTFLAMAIYGSVTKTDLTTMGNLSMMALFGLIIGMVINMFLQSAQFDYILSGIGVIVFVLLTAYDTQKIKQMARQVSSDEMANKVALMGALTLYLDFINLFLYLLRFMGKRNQE